MAAWTAAVVKQRILLGFPLQDWLRLLTPVLSLTDHHGPPKVNLWEDPFSPSRWKEEHFFIASLSRWGLLFYGGYKFFIRDNKDKKEEKVGEPAH